MVDVTFLKPGSRTTLCGKTGSGKSTIAITMLRKSRQKWILIDPKADDKIATLNPAVIHSLKLADVQRAWKEGYQYVAIQPPPQTKPLDIDAFILDAYENLTNFGVYIDELYYIHNAGRAGDGLTAILTRGRSDKITYLGATQRPAWISLFCLSEADYIAQFKLQLENDRKRIYSVTGEAVMLNNPPAPYSFYYYDSPGDSLRYFVTGG